MLRMLTTYAVEDGPADALAYYALQKSRYEVLVLRAVQLPLDGAWRACGWTLRAYVPGTAPEARQDQVYRSVRFVEQRLQIDDFETFLQRAVRERVIADLPAAGDISPRMVRATRSSTAVGRGPCGSRRASWQFEYVPAELQTVAIPYSSIVEFDLPPLIEPDRFAASWLRQSERPGRGHDFARCALVVLPETRCVFDSIARIREDRLLVRVARGAGYGDDVRLKGALRVGSHVVPIDHVIDGPDLEVDAHPDAEALTLCLVARDGSVLDFHSENPSEIDGRQRALGEGSEESGESGDVRERVAAGEDHVTEFKPFLAADDSIGRKKLNETLESICAFANTAGGTILVGVNDHGDVQGPPFAETEEPPEAIQRHVRTLRERIGDGLHPTPRFDIAIVRVDGLCVVRIEVEESDEKPIALTATREIYVRRGSTDRTATSEELREMFRASDADGAGSLGAI